MKSNYKTISLTIMALAAGFITTLNSCTDETIAYEGNWVLTDTLPNKAVNQTLLNISSNKFSIQYDQKGETSDTYKTFATQKGDLNKFAEYLSLEVQEFGFLPQDNSTSLKSVPRTDAQFAKNIDSLNIRTLNIVKLLIKDSTEKYKFEAAGGKLILKLGTAKLSFDKK